MKKISYLISVFTLLIFASCSKNFDANNEGSTYGKKTIEYSIEANAPGEGTTSTKASLGAVARVFWESDDMIYVFAIKDGNITYSGELSVTGITSDGSKATFSGTLIEPVKGSTLFFTNVMPTVPYDNKITIDISHQGVNGSNNRIFSVVYATSEYSSTQVSIKSVDFKLATSYMNIVVDASNCREVEGLAKFRIMDVAENVSFSFSNNEVQLDELESSGRIWVLCSSIGVTNGKVMLPVAVPKSKTVDSNIKRQIDFSTDFSTRTEEQGEYDFFADFTNAAFKEGKSYTTSVSMKHKNGFTVDKNGKQVKFDLGNLFWNGSEFLIETNQYDYPKSWDPNHVGHFFWSKEASVAYAESYNDSFATELDPFFASNFVYSPTCTKRTLSAEEWKYLLNTRLVAGKSGQGYSYKQAYINTDTESVNGIIVYPDGFSRYLLEPEVNRYTSSEWESLEYNGCIFLPLAGFRVESSIIKNLNNLYTSHYWSSTPSGMDNAIAMGHFYYEDVHPDQYESISVSECNRDAGRCIRLVQDCD